MFSSSLVISATEGELTGTTRRKMLPYMAEASSEAIGPQPPTTLGMSWRATVSLPGSSRSGEEGDVKAGIVWCAGYFEAELVADFEARDDQLFRGAGVGGAFEDDELALFNVGRNGFDGAGDVAEVGLVVFVERGGDADDDGVHFGHVGVVGSGAETGLLGLLDRFGQDADDVGAAAVERGDFGWLDVEAGDAEAFVAEEQGQRQADVAHADDADAGFAGFHFALEFFDAGG